MLALACRNLELALAEARERQEAEGRGGGRGERGSSSADGPGDAEAAGAGRVLEPQAAGWRKAAGLEKATVQIVVHIIAIQL